MSGDKPASSPYEKITIQHNGKTVEIVNVNRQVLKMILADTEQFADSATFNIQHEENGNIIRGTVRLGVLRKYL